MSTYQLPPSWASKRLKYVASYNDETLPESTDELDEIEYVEISDVSLTGGVQASQRMAFGDAPSRARRRVRSGDILISTVRTYLKAIAPVEDAPDDLIASTGFCVVRPGPDVDSGFLGWVAQSEPFVNEVVARSVGVSYPAINASELVTISVPLPPLDVQRRIARFLDDKTARIDALVEKKRALLDRLAEKRQSLITAAVTKGLDPDVPMKPSGVEWLGNVPEHWKVVPLKRLGTVRSGITKGKTYSDEETATLPYLRVANVQDGWLDLSDVSEIEVRVADVERYSLRDGDILMNEGGDNDKLGRGSVWRSQIPTCLHQNHVFAVRLESANPDWVARCTEASYAKFHFYRRAVQSTNLASISKAVVNDLPVPLPPPDEVTQTLNSLNSTIEQLNTLKERIQRSVETQEEYRAALVTAAVTGQIEDLR